MKKLINHLLMRTLDMSEQSQKRITLPSGIDGITLQKSKDILKSIKGITIEEMGQHMGVSRTARRYLEYLVFDW